MITDLPKRLFKLKMLFNNYNNLKFLSHNSQSPQNKQKRIIINFFVGKSIGGNLEKLLDGQKLMP